MKGVIHTALQLIKLEIVSKSNYQKSKPTVDVMQDIINVLQHEIKVNEGHDKK
jgi:hypothetical protein